MAKSIKQFLRKLYNLSYYRTDTVFGKLGEGSVVPQSTVLSNPQNLYIDEHVHIGEDAVLYSTNAKIIIKKFFISAMGLRIATGDHERRIGRFLASITENDKNHNAGLDKDVIINEDVWAGFGVTILAGVEIGRGCTIASGSVVTRSLPPYSVCGGVPSKPIRFYWTIEQILEHEAALYPVEERYTREQLDDIFKDIKIV